MENFHCQSFKARHFAHEIWLLTAVGRPVKYLRIQQRLLIVEFYFKKPFCLPACSTSIRLVQKPEHRYMSRTSLLGNLPEPAVCFQSCHNSWRKRISHGYNQIQLFIVLKAYGIINYYNFSRKFPVVFAVSFFICLFSFFPRFSELPVHFFIKIKPATLFYIPENSVHRQQPAG